MHVRIILTVHLLLINQSSDCFEVLCQRRNETQSSCWSLGTWWPRPGCPGRFQPWSPGMDLSGCELCVPSQGSCSLVLGSLLCVSDKLFMVSCSKVFSAHCVLCTTRSFYRFGSSTLEPLLPEALQPPSISSLTCFTDLPMQIMSRLNYLPSSPEVLD